MTKQYDDNNSGVLFRNDKATTDKHPTHTGRGKLDGRDYYISAWVKEGKRGKFFSLSFKPVDEQAGGHPERFANPKGAEIDLDDAIPF